MRFHRILSVVGFCLLAGFMSAHNSFGAGTCPPYEDGSLGDPTPLFNAIDLNHDGKLTQEEWKKVEAPEPSWQAFMKKALVQKHGYITLFDFLTDSPPGGIDTNCDGEFSLDEFLATKKMKMGGGDSGGPGGASGGAPQGAAPQGAAPAAGGASQGAASSTKTITPTAPREALPKGSYSTDGPGTCPPYSDGGIADPTPLFNAIDTNRDGKLTQAEWKAAKAPEPSWNAFMSKPRVKKNGYITLYDFVMDTPPGGIDTNCDGEFSLDEFLATKTWKMGGGAGDKGGAAPQGAATQAAPAKK
jgi:hypothetical protein